jgi:hypothetical protein
MTTRWTEKSRHAWQDKQGTFVSLIGARFKNNELLTLFSNP